MKAFLSYSTTDKNLAGRVKSFLERIGIEAFLAHDDIKPTEEWQDEILRQLDSCDLFIAIITSDFANSKWTSQETGFALSRKIPIIPIDAGEKPYGFLARIQALPFDTKELTSSFKQLAKVISNMPLGTDWLYGLITTFGNSGSFTEAESLSDLVIMFSAKYTKPQKNLILRIASANYQIYKAGRAKRNLERFIAIHRTDLSGDLVDELEEKIR